MTGFKVIVAILVGFSAGIVVAGGIFAFIAIIGIVPRLAQRTKTISFLPVYEDVITLGGIFGITTLFVPYYLPVGKLIVMILGLAMGVFVGGMAISLAEVLNVIPIFMRRSRLLVGMPVLVLAIALGKLVGELLYALIPGFFF